MQIKNDMCFDPYIKRCRPLSFHCWCNIMKSKYPNMQIREDKCYDLFVSFFGGQVWGISEDPPFKDAKTCRKWIDDHTILKFIVLSRCVATVDDYKIDAVHKSVVTVAVIRVMGEGIRKLFDALTANTRIKFDCDSIREIDNASIAARLKIRKHYGGKMLLVSRGVNALWRDEKIQQT